MKLEPKTTRTMTWDGIRFSLGHQNCMWVDVLTVDFNNPDQVEIIQLLKQHHSAFLAALRLQELIELCQRAKDHMKTCVYSYEPRYATDMFDEIGKKEDVHSVIALLIERASSQEYWDLPKGYETLADDLVAVSTLREEYNRKMNMRDHVEKYRDAHHGYVYLFRLSTGHFKIGFSNNPQRRGREIISGLPLTLDLIHQIPSNQIACLEDELHKHFRAKRYENTEWFTLQDADIAYVKAITEKNYEWVDNTEWTEFYKMIDERRAEHNREAEETRKRLLASRPPAPLPSRAPTTPPFPSRPSSS